MQGSGHGRGAEALAFFGAAPARCLDKWNARQGIKRDPPSTRILDDMHMLVLSDLHQLI